MLLGVLSSLSAFLPVGAYAWRFRKLFRCAPLRPLALYLIVSLFMEVVGLVVLGSGQIVNTLPLLHAYTVIEFSLLLVVFHHVLRSLSLRFVQAMILLFLTAELLVSFTLQSFFDYNTLIRGLEALVLVTLSLRYFYESLKHMGDRYLETSFSFWFCAAVLLYFSGNLVVFASSNFLRTVSRIATRDLWIFHAALNVLFNTLLTISLWMRLPEQDSK